MSSTVALTSNLGRWLPRNSKEILDWLNEEVRRSRKKRSAPGGIGEALDPLIQALQDLIEDNSEINMYFHQMFDQLPPDIRAGLKFQDYKGLMQVINDTVIDKAPTYNSFSPMASGVPLYAVLSFFCNTPAGYNAFVNPLVNEKLHQIFVRWMTYLETKESAYTLIEGNVGGDPDTPGWFSPVPLEALEKDVGAKFEVAWQCNKDLDHWGFTSWDHFFTRYFRDMSTFRPVDGADDQNVITSACEATIHLINRDVPETASFWLKTTPYSLQHMLNNDYRAPKFAGGTVYQAMLSSMAYHRWVSPVDGVVKDAYVVPGTYYAARLDNETHDPDVISRSQDFVTAISTRALIFIEADNDDIGLMCFIGVGLGEISTCKLEVERGNRLVKGQTELGSFHFGGSTYCLVFRPETKLAEYSADVAPEKLVRINKGIFRVTN